MFKTFQKWFYVHKESANSICIGGKAVVFFTENRSKIKKDIPANYLIASAVISSSSFASIILINYSKFFLVFLFEFQEQWLFFLYRNGIQLLSYSKIVPTICVQGAGWNLRKFRKIIRNDVAFVLIFSEKYLVKVEIKPLKVQKSDISDRGCHREFLKGLRTSSRFLLQGLEKIVNEFF